MCLIITFREYYFARIKNDKMSLFIRLQLKNDVNYVVIESISF